MRLNLKHLLMAIIGLLFALPSNAKETLSEKVNSLHYNHLHEVNAEWKNYAPFAPKKNISFNTDADRIQSHLKLVIKYLKEQGSPNLNLDQQTRRLQLLNELNDYANKKVFPMNTVYNHRQPCFVDEKQTHCAVGYMMAVSGHHELVENIRLEYNYNYLQDIKTDGVMEWANEYGFTLEELKWIQPGYGPTEQYDALGAGSNGEVRIMEPLNGAGNFVLAGDFTELDGLPCLNIGIYNDAHLSCLGEGVAGTINSIYKNNDGYFIFGALQHEAITYPMATFTDGVWTFVEIPTRAGATATAGHAGPYFGYELQIAISHPDIVGQEIWFLEATGEWAKKAKIGGTIYDIERANSIFIFVGHFTNTMTVDTDGEATMDFANNILIYHHYDFEWEAVNQPVSDTIKCAKAIGSAVYLGGSAHAFTESEICLSRYYLGVVSPLRFLSHFNTSSYVSLNDIEYDNDSKLILAGDFELVHEFGDWGQYLATFDLVYNRLHAISMFNKSASCVLWRGDDLYVGGKFTTDPFGEALNHLVKLRRLVGLPENSDAVQLLVYPNPFSNSVQIKGILDATSYTLFNQMGQAVKQGQIENQSIQHLDDLPKGSYLLVLKSNDKEWQIKLLK